MAEQALANRTSASSSMPRSRPYTQPALKVSPAPSVLRTCTWKGFSRRSGPPFRPYSISPPPWVSIVSPSAVRCICAITSSGAMPAYSWSVHSWDRTLIAAWRCSGESCRQSMVT